jgi:prepilin-type processing-associated H-X9-DG protein
LSWGGNSQASQLAQAQIVIMSDAIGLAGIDNDILMFNHKPGGSNVLFMDGHVEFVRYRGAPHVSSPIADFAAAVPRQ